MNHETVARLLVVAIFALLAIAILVYDVWSYLTFGDASHTASRLMWQWAREHPIIPFTFGVLMGHLFW